MPLENSKDLRQKLLTTHPQYKNYVDRWKFLIDSYQGGKDYRDGKYLTAYLMESQEQYETRLDDTPYDNHCKAITAIYNSFLFRQPPERNYGSIENDPGLDAFLEDADLDGRTFEAVMRDVSTYATVYGNVWCIVDKPPTNAYTRAEELEQGIRPYISIVTPENVLDWRYERSMSGYYTLTYLKVYEGQTSGSESFRVYTPEMVTVYTMHKDEAYIEYELLNPLGKVPAVCVYGQRSPIKGIGVSDVGDVADMSRGIYQELSEVQQLGRLTNHPSLVKTASTQASAGAGAIIQMPEDLQADLKPYLLQPDGGSIQGFLDSMKSKVEAIDRMAHMGGIRSIETRRLSGVALATEFQLLNARLAEKADNLEIAEEQIWRLYAQWQGAVWNGKIKYPDSFNIQDKYNDMNMLKLAKEAQPESKVVNKVIEEKMLELLVDEDEYEEYYEQMEQFEPHIMYGPNGEVELARTEQEHLDLAARGYTHEKPNGDDDAEEIGSSGSE